MFYCNQKSEELYHFGDWAFHSGKFSKIICKNMEFSICCLTPPPNFREVEWGGGGVGLDQKSEISNFFDLVLSTLKTFNLGLKLPFYLL